MAERDTTRVTVKMPSLFESFLADSPRLNLHYSTVRPSREAALSQFCGFDQKMRKAISQCDFAYFMAVSAPDADIERLSTMCDWGNWVFPFDDLFDTGELRDKPEEAIRLIQSLLAGMSAFENARSKEPIVQWHNRIWATLRKPTTASTENAMEISSIGHRFSRRMADYCAGVLMHVRNQAQGRHPGPEDMILIRAKSAGVSPVFTLVEFAHSLCLPATVFDDPSIRELELLGAEFVLIQNDLLGYRKEESEDVVHNLVASYRLQGKSAQQAFDAIGRLLDARYERWDRALQEVPSWGAEVDNDVRKYIEGIADVVKANLHWSFRTGRYKLDPATKETGELSVMLNPPYLKHSTKTLSL